MWYAVLPTFTIITAALYVANMYGYLSNKLVFGQPYRRVITDGQTSFMFLRDSRLSGKIWSYEYNGLNNIPDLETAKNE